MMAERTAFFSLFSNASMASFSVIRRIPPPLASERKSQSSLTVALRRSNSLLKFTTVVRRCSSVTRVVPSSEVKRVGNDSEMTPSSFSLARARVREDEDSSNGFLRVKVKRWDSGEAGGESVWIPMSDIVLSRSSVWLDEEFIIGGLVRELDLGGDVGDPEEFPHLCDKSKGARRTGRGWS